MRRREAFHTGKPHQSAVANWARVRLADRGGRDFNDQTGQATPKQTGCLLADGVGLGKTWEALAAAALLLDKRASTGRRARAKKAKTTKRIRQRRLEAHVLILLPPGLVAKWFGELRNGEATGFPARLKRWAGRVSSRSFVAKTLEPDNCFEIRKRKDLDSLPHGQIKRRKYTLPAGTYLCNWNVFLGIGGRGRDRVTALKNQQWDVVVVDEAHHLQARKALDKVKHPAFTLLVTATPFQLDMTELHGLTRHLIHGKAPAHKVLTRGAVRDYAKAADRAFDGGNSPTPSERKNAEAVLTQLIACSKVGRQQRHYFAIDANGTPNPVTPPSALEAKDLVTIFGNGVSPSPEFAEWYVRRRLGLARREAGEVPKHVAIELQKLLSIRKPPAPESPRLTALRAWARQQFVEDLQLALDDGRPRKLLVFTHLKTNVTGVIKRALEEELDQAYRTVAATPRWRSARKVASKVLDDVLTEVKQRATSDLLLKRLETFARAIRGSLFHDLFASKTFAANAKQELLRVTGAEELATRSRNRRTGDKGSANWYASQRRAKESAAIALLDAIAKAPLAATFTGDDTRRERDAIAEAFKTSFAPWILVATNVGSEGIDLHTYSRHLVHFDVEWNPARMEQREGRIDRLGRALKEPARIYYLLVKDTYDERMFHQLIARQRWHSVLLGRKALRLREADAPVARLLSTGETATMSLNLDPRHQL